MMVVAGPVFYRADADDNGSVQLTDGIFILNFLFLGGGSPTCFDAADAANNGSVQLTDGIFILNFLFLGGAAPPAPGECRAAEETQCGEARGRGAARVVGGRPRPGSRAGRGGACAGGGRSGSGEWSR